METTPSVRILIDLHQTEADAEFLEDRTIRLLEQLREMNEVQEVHRVLDENVPDHNKSFMATLAGLLAVNVSMNNIKAVFGFLGDRLGDKPIELEVDVNGAKLTIKASSRQEFEVARQTAEDFVAKMKVANG